jgi:hypothetical protein
MHLGIFNGTNDEQAFLASTNEVQCQRLREELLRRDAEGWPAQGQPMPPTPVMPEPEPQPQTETPESTQMQPPQFPRPVIPSTVGPAAGQPMQMPQAQPQMQPPAYQQQSPPMGMPQMPVFQQQQQQQQPQAAQMPQMPPQAAPVSLPQMQAPQWQMPAMAQPQAPVAAPVLPSGRSPAVPTAPATSGLGDVLTKIAEVQAANQKMLEAIHRHQLEGNAIMGKILGVLITTPQMQGIPMESLVQAVLQVGGEETVKSFLQAISGGPSQGKA